VVLPLLHRTRRRFSNGGPTGKTTEISTRSPTAFVGCIAMMHRPLLLKGGTLLTRRSCPPRRSRGGALRLPWRPPHVITQKSHGRRGRCGGKTSHWQQPFPIMIPSERCLHFRGPDHACALPPHREIDVGWFLSCPANHAAAAILNGGHSFGSSNSRRRIGLFFRHSQPKTF
jgi:hypothetical protein